MKDESKGFGILNEGDALKDLTLEDLGMNYYDLIAQPNWSAIKVRPEILEAHKNLKD